MSKLALFLADGFEEIEGLTVVDICRRCGLELDTISITERLDILGSHGIPVRADRLLGETALDGYDCLILPGGKVGTENLEACEPLCEALDAAKDGNEGKTDADARVLAAICAAPSIFAHRGFLKGRNATCHPAFESHLIEGGAELQGAPVEVSDSFITGQGMGASIPFALTIAARYAGREKAKAVADAICYRGEF